MSRHPDPAIAVCPCGDAAYGDCCGRWHAGGAAAPTAEALMRSRYAAYALSRADYLQSTWHPRTRPATLTIEPGTRWLGLRVIAARTTGPDTAEVEFVARYRIGGASAVRLHERSRFVREDARWWYVDGDLPPR